MTGESPSLEQEIVQPATSESAESLPAEGAKQDEVQSPLEAVTAALAEDAAAAEQPKEASGQPESPKQDGEGKQQDDADPHAEFVKTLSPKNREHWNKLQSERDGYREKASAFEQITGAVRQAGLNGDEFNAGFDIMRTIKAVQRGQASPAEALAKLTPYVDQLRTLAGEVLPDDLNDRVGEGSIGQQEASELARLRAENQTLRGVREAETREAEQMTAQQQAQQLAASMGQAVTAWEQAWSSSDPDYKVKASLVKSRITELMQSEGLPKSPEDAVKLSERAKRDIEQHLGGVLQKRSDVRTVTGGRPSSTPKPSPKSPLDAVNQALNAS